MKTVLEQLAELKNQLEEMSIHLANTESFKTEPKPESTEFEPCCSDNYCGCGCDEPEIETIQVASFEEAQVISFTKEELIAFATELTERVVTTCKEAVTDTNIDAEDVVELSMGYGHQIEVELDQDSIVRSIHDEIDGSVETDNDSIEEEVIDILRTMKQS